tara:strand:+ start:485 stop:1333 length:849 start_codon:yes stop_codon:yes gene_type:complete
MHSIYKIENTHYLEPETEYSNADIYPLFQENYLDFKKTLTTESRSKINNTYYKFGDGDYLLFKNQKHGTTKPGVRDIKKSFRPIDIPTIRKSAHMHDKYFCEIINFKLMNEVLDKNIDFPAEYLYASVANKWFFSNFNKVTIIGSETKLNLIYELMQHSEYKDYLGVESFYDLIPIPQTGALTNSEKIYKKIKSKVEKSKPDIFLAGIGLAQNTLLYSLKNSTNAPIISVGSGVDAIAGVIDIYRPYYGSWTNYRLKNSKLYKKIKDPVLYTTTTGKNVKYL